MIKVGQRSIKTRIAIRLGHPSLTSLLTTQASAPSNEINPPRDFCDGVVAKVVKTLIELGRIAKRIRHFYSGVRENQVSPVSGRLLHIFTGMSCERVAPKSRRAPGETWDAVVSSKFYHFYRGPGDANGKDIVILLVIFEDSQSRMRYRFIRLPGTDEASEISVQRTLFKTVR